MTGSKFLLRTDTAGADRCGACFRVSKLCGGATGIPWACRFQPDAAVISHAHLDHGYLPALGAARLQRPVFMTADTAALAEIFATALLQEGRRYARTVAAFSGHSKPKPLYDLDDAERTATVPNGRFRRVRRRRRMKSRCGLCPQVTFLGSHR